MAQTSILSQSTQRAKAFWIAQADKATFEFALLAVITLAAALLRFYKLGEWSFWGDEVFTISLKEDGFNYSIWRRSLATTLIRAVTAARGDSEWNARLVPAIIGIISIPLLYWVIRRVFGKNVAMIASVLLALSPWHIYWSQNARFYILLLLFYSLGMMAFYIGLEEDRPWWILAALVLLGMAARERLLALFFVPVILVYLLCLKILPVPQPPGLRSRNLLLFFTPAVILGGLLAGPFLANLSQWMASFGRINNSPFWIFSGVLSYIGLPVFSLAIFGAAYLLARRERAALYFGLGAVVPLVGVMGISLFHYSANRYVFVSLMSWVILAGLTVMEIFNRLNEKGWILAVGIFALLVFTSVEADYMYFNYQNGNRPNWKAAFAFIQERKLPGDRIFTSDQDIADYYLKEKTGSLQIFDFNNSYWLTKRIWMLEDLDAEELYPEQLRWMKENALQVANFDVRFSARVFAMRVYLYVPGAR